MSNPELPTLLRALHAELGRAERLDPESRRLLELVLEDARRVPAGAPAVAPGSPGGASPAAGAGAQDEHGVEALAVRFEADHPALASILRQVADVLGKAGV